jgi:hypothetical protein
MTREHPPCAGCGRFLSAVKVREGAQGPGHCEGFDRPAYSTDQPCVLFIERGAWKTRQAEGHGQKQWQKAAA